MKIGVALVLDRDPGELFADARALEAAGADSFWAAPGEDELVLLAAIAAVTWRARIVAVGAAVAPALETLGRLARGRLVIGTARGEEIALSVTEGDDERWRHATYPTGRAAWREIRAKGEADGVAGLVLPNDPRLLDLIRNPDVEDDRSDIKLAFG